MLNIASIFIALMFAFLFLTAENIRDEIIASVYQYFVYALFYNPYVLYGAYSRTRYPFFAEG